MKHYWIGPVLLVAALVIGFGSAAQAVVKVGRYYEDHGIASCSDFNCALVFKRIPAGDAVLITRVSCAVNTSAVPDFLYLGIRNKNDVQLDRREYFAITKNPSNSWYSASAETLFRYAPEQVPLINIQVTPDVNVSLICRIAGERPSPL